MVDLSLMYHLLNACHSKMSILLVGDPHQLPSIGCGNVLSACVQSKQLSYTKLKNIYWQGRGATSNISLLSKYIVSATMPPLHVLDDSIRIRSETSYSRANTNKEITTKVGQLYEKYGNDCIIMSPMRKGPLGTIAIMTIFMQGLLKL